MSTLPKDRPNVVDFGARRSERTSVEIERQQLEERWMQIEALGRELERERVALGQQRTRLEEEQRVLEQARVEFEEELAVLEEQRHFLDAQREKVRLEEAAVESGREALSRTHALASQRQRVENVLEDARRSREDEKLRLRAEMEGLLGKRVDRAH